MGVQDFLRAAFGRAEWPPIDRALLATLHLHGLAGFAYAALGRAKRLEAIDRPTRDALRSAVMANVHAEVERAAPLTDALRALAERGVPVIAWKGLDYAHRLYADPAERPMGDHDLLVPPERFHEARQALAALGYRDALVQRGVAAHAGHYAAQLVRDRHHLDLHRGVRQESRASIDYAAVFARSLAGDLRGTPVRWLDPRDRLLLHVYHQAAHELAVPLITFVDLELMLPVDRVTIDRARRYGIEKPLHAALALRDDLFGFVSRRRRWQVLMPSVKEVCAGERPPRALQLVRKAALIDTPRALLRFADYALRG